MGTVDYEYQCYGYTCEVSGTSITFLKAIINTYGGKMVNNELGMLSAVNILLLLQWLLQK